ncbi:hypothetical protein Tco_1345174 [Tanacetum coccineum]
MGGDEIEVSDDESSDLEEYLSDKEETIENFKIETDVFYYETPLCLAFNEFNYLLKEDPDYLQRILWGLKPMKITKMIGSTNGTRMYHGYMTSHGLIMEYGRNQNESCILASLSTIKLDVRNGQPVVGERMDREDNELKDEALRIMEGLISDDESSNDCWKRWKSHEIYYHNYDDGEYKNETHEEGHELCGIETHKVPVCQIKRYKMIKYPFNDEEEYVAVKEDEYDDLTITSEEACRAYQEIFRMMDEG